MEFFKLIFVALSLLLPGSALSEMAAPRVHAIRSVRRSNVTFDGLFNITSSFPSMLHGTALKYPSAQRAKIFKLGLRAKINVLRNQILQTVLVPRKPVLKTAKRKRSPCEGLKIHVLDMNTLFPDLPSCKVWDHKAMLRFQRNAAAGPFSIPDTVKAPLHFLRGLQVPLDTADMVFVDDSCLLYSYLTAWSSGEGNGNLAAQALEHLKDAYRALFDLPKWKEAHGFGFVFMHTSLPENVGTLGEAFLDMFCPSTVNATHVLANRTLCGALKLSRVIVGQDSRHHREHGHALPTATSRMLAAVCSRHIQGLHSLLKEPVRSQTYGSSSHKFRVRHLLGAAMEPIDEVVERKRDTHSSGERYYPGRRRAHRVFTSSIVDRGLSGLRRPRGRAGRVQKRIESGVSES
eukprot:jgi/Botrbrau1/19043/Bobra.0100s0069.1